MTPKTTKESKKEIAKVSNYAIVETSGTQFWLEANRYYDVDRIDAKADETITLNKVLLINDKDGLSIGQPYINGASVEAKVVEHRRGPKIIVYKMRPKKKTRTKNGHRQELTRIIVKSISKGTKPKKTTNTTKGKEASPQKTPISSKSKEETSTKTAPSSKKSSKVDKATE